MLDHMFEFETVTPDKWLAEENKWNEKLLQLPNWYQVTNYNP